ncbi:MAG: aminomethyl-transferring glycine dehydrogenase subunit GcvPB [Fimbriimonadaceae bacterium]|nr:aminomethyl-transferring glycine dehydrogenase subunit GcvPB [Fimbriimonadaceae bacterium]QYK55130.1 MAG: aminomethyl-transferring glycine dehydrogenase subunit GcvPB [Fimbriimonadaceae bacterium]
MDTVAKSVPQPKLIFERSRSGRIGCNLPKADTPEVDLEAVLGNVRAEVPWPEIAELDLLRHFTNLSQINYGIETGFYPLGSCTMKYNPKINERTGWLSGFAMLHPLQPEPTVDGALEVLASVYDFLKEITGFDAITMQPVAGAHGELTCLMLIKAYHESRGQGDQRKVVLVPDSAHGTNPASAARCGYDVKTIPTDAEGNTDLAALEKALDDTVAAFMVTNPSTLGLFELHIQRVCEIVHAAGGQVFCDGANMNAMVGTTRPGDHGFDCMHLNLHKTFSTPHGGGGPGCGAIGIKSHLEPFLPAPVLQRGEDGKPYFDRQRPLSIGRVSGYYGQFLMAVRALTYLLAYGKEGLPQISRFAVLNANYVKARLKDVLPAAYDRPCMHECVLTATPYKKGGVRALDISKRLIDYGFHPPTNYFPLIVPEAMMIEPTETEAKETLDAFCDALVSICEEAKADPNLLHSAPTSQIVGRLDEASAVKRLDVKWSPGRDPVTV